MVPDVFRRFLLRRPANFADQYHCIGIRVGVEPFQDIGERLPYDGIAPNANTGGLPEPVAGKLIHGLIGQRSAAGDDSNTPREVDVARHDANLGRGK